LTNPLGKIDDLIHCSPRPQQNYAISPSPDERHLKALGFV
jgi:hypothetical protein